MLTDKNVRQLYFVMLFLLCCGLGITACTDNPSEDSSTISGIGSQLDVQNSATLHDFEGSTMGTTYHIKAVLPKSLISSQLEISQLIKSELNDIESKMSTYRSDSELTLFNAHPVNSSFVLSPSTIEVLTQALYLSNISEGAFDVTVGPLVNLWGFGPGESHDVVPNKSALLEAFSRVGYKSLKLDVVSLELKKTKKVFVDLSAIAKGYAVDRVINLLHKKGILNVLVEVGGEIRSSGVKPNQMDWRIAIETPVAGERSIQRIISVTDIAMATSGDYRNYFEINGRRFSHTIDPNSGYPIDHSLASVTVLANSCMQADGLATTLMVLGPVKGLAFAEKYNLSAFFIIKTPSGFKEISTQGFSQYIQ